MLHPVGARALVIGHDHVTGLEHLGRELVARSYGLGRLPVVPSTGSPRPMWRSSSPAATCWDLVVTLGAPWPRERIAGWASDEIEFLAAARERGAAVLGICFGAQLLAESFGAPAAVALGEPRIGWYPVTPRVPDVEAGPRFPTGGPRGGRAAFASRGRSTRVPCRGRVAGRAVRCGEHGGWRRAGGCRRDRACSSGGFRAGWCR